MKTRSYFVNEDRRYDEVTRKYYPDGFSFNQNAIVKFDYDKQKMARIMEELSRIENAPNVKVKDAKECKRKILAKAYNDAKLQAEAIALAAGKTLQGCAKVDFKPFTTSYVSQSSFDGEMAFCKASNARGSAQESIVNSFTPEDVELSETLYCLWIAE